MALATAMFRMRDVSITKFASLNFVQVVALAGALAAGVTTTAPAIFAGVLLADLFHHRKPLIAAGINASREMLALYAAYGVYAAIAIRTPGARTVALVPEVVPAIAVFFLTYFLLSRALLYATLLTRNKLLPEEQSLILRYGRVLRVRGRVDRRQSRSPPGGPGGSS
jgi:hypothetical protein